MDNFCLKIPFLPSICASVMLSKLNWGGIPIIITSLIPGDGQCMLPRRAQLTSTYWQSHLLPLVYEYFLLSSELLYFKRSWFICHYHTSHSPKCESKILLSPFLYCPHSHIFPALERTFGRSVGPLICTFWNMLHLGVCRALSTKAGTDLPMNAAGTTAARLVLAINSHIMCLLEKQLLFFHKSCRGFKHIYSELLSVSEMLMLMGSVHHMCTGRI